MIFSSRCLWRVLITFSLVGSQYDGIVRAYQAPTPFELLGLQPDIHLEKTVIKKAYKRMALRYHPDMIVNQHSTPEEKLKANDDFAQINGAYELLMNRNKDDAFPASSNNRGAAGAYGSAYWSSDFSSQQGASSSNYGSPYTSRAAYDSRNAGRGRTSSSRDTPPPSSSAYGSPYQSHGAYANNQRTSSSRYAPQPERQREPQSQRNPQYGYGRRGDYPDEEAPGYIPQPGPGPSASAYGGNYVDEDPSGYIPHPGPSTNFHENGANGANFHDDPEAPEYIPQPRPAPRPRHSNGADFMPNFDFINGAGFGRRPSSYSSPAPSPSRRKEQSEEEAFNFFLQKGSLQEISKAMEDAELVVEQLSLKLEKLQEDITTAKIDVEVYDQNPELEDRVVELKENEVVMTESIQKANVRLLRLQSRHEQYIANPTAWSSTSPRQDHSRTRSPGAGRNTRATVDAWRPENFGSHCEAAKTQEPSSQEDIAAWKEKYATSYGKTKSSSSDRKTYSKPQITELECYDNDPNLLLLLENGSYKEVASEMEYTQQVVHQLSSELENMRTDLITAEEEAEDVAISQYNEKSGLEDKFADLKVRMNVLEQYLKNALKRLMKLQTRQNQLVVNGESFESYEKGRGSTFDYSAYLDESACSTSEPEEDSLDNDPRFCLILETGSLKEISEELDDTELVVEHLSSKLGNLHDEITMVEADIRNFSFKYMSQLELEEKVDDLKEQKETADGYLQEARHRLSKLQTRCKELMVNDTENDFVASGDDAYVGTSSSSTTSNAASSSANEGTWQKQGFGSYGRGRGISREHGYIEKTLIRLLKLKPWYKNLTKEDEDAFIRQDFESRGATARGTTQEVNDAWWRRKGFDTHWPTRDQKNKMKP